MCGPPHRIVRTLGVFVVLSCLSALAAGEALRVTCTTTLLSCVARGIGGQYVEVTTIVPFGMCPGHFDLTPREAAALRKADLVLAHGFERFLDDVKAGNPDMAITKVSAAGNWMVPPVQKAGARAVTEVLCMRRPALAETFRANLAAYLHAVDKTVLRQQGELKQFYGTHVLCSIMNRELVEWFGFEVIAAFPRDEDLSAKTLADIIRMAKRRGIQLVVDNRQSSGKVGRTFAAELTAPLVVLNNFPPDKVGPAAYISALTENRVALLAAMAGPIRKQ